MPSWKIFKVLGRLQVPKQYVTGWKIADHDFFLQRSQPGFKLKDVNSNYVNLGGRSFAEVFPDTIRTLEIISDETHPRDAQIYRELQGLVNAAGQDGVYSRLENIYLIHRLGGRKVDDEVVLLHKHAGDLITLTKPKRINILSYHDTEWRLPRENSGPTVEVDLTHGKPVMRWELIPPTELLNMNGHLNEVAARCKP